MPTAITVFSQFVIVVISFAMRLPAASDPGASGSGRPSRAWRRRPWIDQPDSSSAG
jgi:hypothetical protein